MATTTTTTKAPTTTTLASDETTFRSFSIDQGTNYAQHRKDYNPVLYQIILNHHRATGGKSETVVDVGCGPGIATRSLAPRFRRAVGVDASAGMIAAARSLTSPEARIQFEHCPVEQLGQVNNTGLSGPAIPDGTVDLLTSASAVHWFDMAVFWATAARLLKPGGSVALWANASIVVDPQLNPHIHPAAVVSIQAALDRIFDRLDAYMPPGNRLLHGLYRDLHLPWTLPAEAKVAEHGLFVESTFLRKEWTGILDEDGSPFMALDNQPFSLSMIERVLGTTSPYVRWREAHPAEAGKDGQDPVKLLRAEIEDALRNQSGVEDPAKSLFNLSCTGALLIVKKKKKVDI